MTPVITVDGRAGRRICLFLAGAVLLLADPWITGAAAFASAKLRCDFDQDGRTDLAIGVPGDNNGRGAVNVQYSPEGFLEVGAYFRRGLNLPGAAGTGQRVGSSLACGDFDGDGFADLAIGVPGESLARGAVVVVYGSAAGLVNKLNTYLTQNTIGLDTVAPAEEGDRFGETLAAGDFNSDGRDDLAIGVPGEFGAIVNAAGQLLEEIADLGTVHIVFGGSVGVAGPAQTFSPLTPGACCVIPDAAHYGAALAVGDFDGDGVEDLAIGAPFAEVMLDADSSAAGGSVHILRGEAGTGLVFDGQSYLHEQLFSTKTTPQFWEMFGLSLAAGQFDGDGGDDLAIGAPFERFDGNFRQHDEGYGAVYVAYFSGADLTSFQKAIFSGSSAAGGHARSSERFGWALVAGDFDGQHDDDLVIGIPAHVPSINQLGGTSGGAVAFFSDGTQLTTTGAQLFFPGDFESGVQTPPALEGRALQFGAALGAGDYQGDGVADLFVGVPQLTLAFENAGGVEIRPGVQGSGFEISYLLLTQDTWWKAGQTWQAAASKSDFDTEVFGTYSDLFRFKGERMGHAIGR